MSNKKNKFSAFKLFYDEFIYRENKSVSYDGIKRNIDNIKEFTIELRKTPKFDVEQYMKILDRTNKRIKEQLDNILKVNKGFLEFYLILYKNHATLSNDKVQDVPFIISTSFYDDYRIDNKSVFDLENSNYVIPRYSSLEKKNIRNEAKKMAKIKYFIKLLNESTNSSKYKKFIDKITYLLKIKPIIRESHFDYFKRLDNHINECKHLWNRIEEYAKKCEDYEFISEKMEIAYKRRFTDWNESIKEIVNEYFDELYNDMINDSEIKGRFSLVNEMTYEAYRETIDNLIQEKEYLVKQFDEGKFSGYSNNGDSYLLQFKSVLINSFFDSRYKKNVGINDGIDAFVHRAIELYTLADDLDDQIFEKIIFDASHSSELRRGNDATTALIVKIYELYNPLYLLSIYERARTEFEDLLDKKTLDFVREYNVKLLDKKMEYDFHGPLPTMGTIRTKIIERRKKFIFEHCITELYSRELLDSYDTRNYDLNVVCKDIPIDDMVDLYHRMKHKIENFDFSNMNFVDSSLVADDYEKNLTLLTAQEFVVKNIFAKLKVKITNDKEILDKYIDICDNYLHEDILFIDNVIKINDDTLRNFEEDRIIFLRTTEWNRFLKNNKLKGSF